MDGWSQQQWNRRHKRKKGIVASIIFLLSRVVVFTCMYEKLIKYADKACHATQVSSIVTFDVWGISDRDDCTAPSKGGGAKVTEKS